MTGRARPVPAALADALGHDFDDPELLRLALTHPSFMDGTHGDYQRLEFLGDAVLSALVADELYHRHPDWDEGLLTKARSGLVSGASLTEAGRGVGIADAIRLGQSEQGADERGLPSAIEGCFEALCGALYLDSGVEAARAFIVAALGPRLDDPASSLPPEHPKSALQERLQALGKAPIYRKTGESGPPHLRTFTVEVSDGETVLGTGTGASKKEAEMRAAEAALEARERRR